MAIRYIPLDLTDPDAVFRITLDGTAYRFRVVWNNISKAAYLSIFTDAGAPIALNRRLSVGSLPLFSSVYLPGVLFVEGPIDRTYTREDFETQTVRLCYMEAATSYEEIFNDLTT